MQLIPTLLYLDAAAAINWLCEAFGFEKKEVFHNEEGLIVHAELIHGNQMIMLGSQNSGSPFSKLTTHPSMIGGLVTQSVYVMTPDVSTLYNQARAAGARIIFDLKTEDYGGESFTCADPEGHIWSIGSYDPWAA